MKRLIPIIPLLILALIFGFACTGTGLEVENTEPKPIIPITKAQLIIFCIFQV